MNYNDPPGVFNFGFDNSLDNIPGAFQSNPSELSSIKENSQNRRKSLINFSALGNESGNNSMPTNQDNNFSNANDKLRLIPSRILSNMGTIQSENNESPPQNLFGNSNNNTSPPKRNLDLPPLSTLLGSSDQDSDHFQSPPPFQPPLNFQNQQFFNDDSEKTSVTLSDSSSGKAIPPAAKPAKKGILKQAKQLKQDQYFDENYSNEQQQPIVKTTIPKEKPPPPPPPPELKMDLDSAFDSAINNFNHYFFNEFKTILRPYSLPIATPEIDNFIFSLSDEISKSLVLPPQTEKNQAIIARTNDTVNLLIKEEMVQVIESMKQKSIRMKSQEEKDISDLKKLDSEIKDLAAQYRKISNHALKNLSNERTELIKVNENDKINQKMFLESKRKLSLKILELESVKSRQNNEILQLQRNENNLYSSREELRERLLNSCDMKFNKLRAKILSEIEGLNEYIEDPIFETISSKSDEIKSILRFGDRKNDQDESKMPQVLFLPQNFAYNNNNNRDENNENNSDDSSDVKEFNNLKSIAMSRLDELRKQREDAFKGIIPKQKKKKKI